MNFKLTGLNALKRDLERNQEEAQRALNSISGTVAKLKFDPSDPESVKQAVREMEAAVDKKVAPYRRNELVAKLAKATKETFRDEILKRAGAKKA